MAGADDEADVERLPDDARKAIGVVEQADR
jgi:hypothetical protein